MKEKFIQAATNLWNYDKPSEAGKIIYDNLANDFRPLWASAILNHCQSLFPPLAEIAHLHQIAQAPERWHEAHEAFSTIRSLSLHPSGRNQELSKLLIVAEYAAKVIYNSSGANAAFDQNSGPRLIKALAEFANEVRDQEFKAKAWEIVCYKTSGT